MGRRIDAHLRPRFRWQAVLIVGILACVGGPAYADEPDAPSVTAPAPGGATVTTPEVAPDPAAALQPVPDGGVVAEFGHLLHVVGGAHAFIGQRIALYVEVPGQFIGRALRLRWVSDGAVLGALDRIVQPTVGGRGRIAAGLVVPAKGLLHVTLSLAEKPETSAIPIAELTVHGTQLPLDDVITRMLTAHLVRLRLLAPEATDASARMRAVLAFQRLVGLPRDGRLAGATVRALADRIEGGFPVRFPGHGRHIEADLSRQLLAEILPGGIVHRVYPISSGKPSTPTIRGHFRVYRRQLGTNELGMVDTNYFRGGYAIHGYASVPSHPASHGCLRVFVPDARPIYDWVRMATPVDVYE